VKPFKLLSPREVELRITLAPTERRKGMLVIMTDITNRAEQEFEAAMIQRMESLVRLAGGVAHEIGNPLNAITIHLELLKKQLKGLPDTKRKELDASLSDIQSETKRLDRIIRNFLKATRKPPLRFRVDSLNDTVADAIGFLKPELDAAGIKTRFTRDNTMPAFLMDRERLYYAFINLIKNAMESMPKGGEVRIALAHKEHCATITIADSGCGISEEALPHIFDIYYTTKQEGAGLGLMMVYDAVKEHGGKIEVKSKVGRGTTFKLLLPVREPQLQLPSYTIKGEPD
jgi:signal transduction histidine kinase